MVTRESPYLTTDIFLHTAVKNKFPQLSLVWYLFNVVSGNRYQIRGRYENPLSITATGDVVVARWLLYLW